MPLESAQHSELLSRSWGRCWSELVSTSTLQSKELGIAGREVFEQLYSKYAEPTRKYHSLQHLKECLAYFEQAMHWAARPAEVEIALWFHDAIYELSRHDNEAASASWAEAALNSAGVDSASVERVMALIMATCHTASPTEQDQCLLVDIDLSILGATKERFAEYEGQIRREYAFVPEPVFSSKRRDILASFLVRPKIYNTPYFFEALESRARANLKHAIDASSESAARKST